jgi:hypothetical protein
LHDPVAHRRDRQRPPFLTTGLRDEDPTRGKRTVATLLEARGQLVEQPIDPVLLDMSKVMRSMPAAPRLARTCPHARSRTSLR